MRKVVGIGVVLILLGSVVYGQEALKVGYGTLKIGGILQTGASYSVADEMAAFYMKRARLLFWGTILPDKVKYFVQTDAVGSPFLLDTKLQFYYVPETEVCIGRFLPNFTHYMPMSTAKLDMINYPLLVSKYAMWRQIGIQTATKTDYLDVNLGVFNGYPANSWTDANKWKDLFGAAAIKPVEGVKLIGYGWLGKTDTLELNANRFGGGLVVDREVTEQVGIALKGEGVMGSDEGITGTETNSLGAYGHLGFKIIPHAELLGRFDYFDPDTDVDDNEEMWGTGGINIFIDGQHAMISINYVMKMEEPEVDNDQVLGQVQVSF